MQSRASGGLSRRRVLGGLGAMSLGAVVMSACGRSGNGGGGNGVSGSIEFLHWDPIGAVGQAFRSVAERFTADHPDVSVNFQSAPIGTYAATLTSQIRSDSLPDLVSLLAYQSNRPAWQGVQELTAGDAGDLLSELTAWDAAAIVPGPGDTYFGIPLGIQGAVWYYSKPAYERAGLDPEQPPETWDDFAQVNEALRGAGIDPIGMGAVDHVTAGFMWHTLLAQYYAADAAEVARFVDKDLLPNDEGMRQTLAAIRETYTRGWWQEGFEGKALANVQDDFMAGTVGNVPGLVGGVLDWATWDAQMEDGSYGAFPAPLLPDAPAGERRLYAEAHEVLGISANSENAETAAEFARFLAARDSQLLLLTEGRQVPNRTDVDIAGELDSAGGIAVAELFANTPRGGNPRNWLTPPAREVIGQRLTQAITDDEIDAMLDQATEEQLRA